jgi:hypothetical protein
MSFKSASRDSERPLKKKFSESLEKLQQSFEKQTSSANNSSMPDSDDHWIRKPSSNRSSDNKIIKTNSQASTNVASEIESEKLSTSNLSKHKNNSSTNSKFKSSDHSSPKHEKTDLKPSLRYTGQKERRFKTNNINRSINKDHSTGRHKNNKFNQSSTSNSDSERLRFDRKATNRQNTNAKYTFYNGSKSYTSNILLDDEFINETLKKAKYINTRPLTKSKRIQ